MLATMLFVSASFAQTVFTASGTFANGATLGGTVTINPATGEVTAINLTVSAPISATLTVAEGTGFGAAYVDFGVGTVSGTTDMTVALPGTTLVGFSGGPLCSTSAPCGGISSGVRVSGVLTQLTSGSLTSGSSAAATPAPPSLWLALSGCLAAFVYALRRRRRNYA